MDEEQTEKNFLFLAKYLIGRPTINQGAIEARRFVKVVCKNDYATSNDRMRRKGSL